MARCEYCGKNIDSMPWKCRRCKTSFCDKHHLPEDHHCSGLKKSKHFKTYKTKFQSHRKRKKSHGEGNYEMYVPNKRRGRGISFSSGGKRMQRFLRKYIYFRSQSEVQDALMSFIPILVMGFVLNYVYYRTLSLSYLFIGGVMDYFDVLIPAINHGFFSNYGLVYLIINGIFYFAFYSLFVKLIFSIVTKLDDRDTWVMGAWIAGAIYLATYFFPRIL